MAEKRIERRLAAILAADVVGYSRLMRADEAGTLSRLKALRAELLDPKVAEYRGRIVKTMGDGVLVEFPSAVDAVSHAADVQQALALRNTGVPEDRRLELRIGINVGDVIIDGEDLYGDGVNVAARMEALAEPGGTCISGTAYDQVKDKLALSLDDLGPQAVKNISEPVRTYRLRPGAATETASHARAEGPSIAVLPFDNMSGDPEQAYFSDGIAEDIITDLSKLSGLTVIARNSSFAYRGQSVDVKRIARELGVGYVLEGSVRKAASRVRITAQLIEGTTAAHLWAERYDRELEDIFAIQDEITGHIVEALKVELALGERERLGGPGTTDVEAYDYVLRGREMLYRLTQETNAEAEGLFEKAIALDPGFTAPYADLAIVVFVAYLSGWNDASEKNLERGLRLAQKAAELDSSAPQGHRALALAHLWRHELDLAIAEAEKAVALGPSYAEAHAVYGNVLAYASRPAESIESLQKAMRLDPRYPDIWLHFLAHAHFIKGDYEAAVGLLQRRIRLKPETDISRALLASCYGHLGRAAEAREAWAKVLEVNPEFSIERRARVLPYKDPADWERIVEGLRKAGLP